MRGSVVGTLTDRGLQLGNRLIHLVVLDQFCSALHVDQVAARAIQTCACTVDDQSHEENDRESSEKIGLRRNSRDQRSKGEPRNQTADVGGIVGAARGCAEDQAVPGEDEHTAHARADGDMRRGKFAEVVRSDEGADDSEDRTRGAGADSDGPPPHAGQAASDAGNQIDAAKVQCP